MFSEIPDTFLIFNKNFAASNIWDALQRSVQAFPETAELYVFYF